MIRDVKKMRPLAEQWRDAPTAREQQTLYDKHGIAWSELWELPYYDPTWQLAVDVMHCILEGLVSFHFHFVLKLTSAVANSKPLSPAAFTHVFRTPLPLDHPDRASEPPWKQLDEKECKHVKLIHGYLTSPIGDEEDITSFEVLFR